MKIIVAVKQVPVRDAAIRIDTAAKWIEEEELSFEINEPDAYALEEALLLKEKHGKNKKGTSASLIVIDGGRHIFSKPHSR